MLVTADAVAFRGSYTRSVQQVTQKILHPSRERADAAAEILDDGGAMIGIVEDHAQPRADAPAILRQRVLEPMQRLHDAHGRPARPIELARRGLPEIDYEVAKLKGFEAGVGMHDDMCGRYVNPSRTINPVTTYDSMEWIFGIPGGFRCRPCGCSSRLPHARDGDRLRVAAGS